MNRRELLKALAAGALITAEGLWFPDTKLISIPNQRILRVYPQVTPLSWMGDYRTNLTIQTPSWSSIPDLHAILDGWRPTDIKISSELHSMLLHDKSLDWGTLRVRLL